MTPTTDQERAEFEAWLGIKPCGAAHDLAWAAWQAARRAQVVPKSINVTEEMHVAAVKVLHRATGVDGLPQRIVDAMLAAAPQPPEAAQLDDINVVDMAQAVDSKEAAHESNSAEFDRIKTTPVQLQESISKVLEDCRSRAIDYATCPSPYNNTRLETAFQHLERQVRQLLAKHGIK